MSNGAGRRYIKAVLFVGMATALEALIWRWVQPSISPLFTAAVTIAALYGGLGPGLLATGLAGVAGAFFFLPPTYSLDVGPDDALRLAVFTAVAIVVSSVADARRQAELRAADAQQAAERANRAKDHFLALVGHELRSPLSPVLAVAGIIESDPALPDEVREDARVIRRNVEFQSRLIDDLLDSSRIQAGKLELRPQRCDVRGVLDDCVAMCAEDASAKSVRVDVRVDPAVDPVILADPARLRQVFANLLRNAIKFTPQGGPAVTLTAAAPAGDGLASRRLRLDVSDGGAGIEPAVLPRVFHAYEQGGRGTTQRHGGLGLGLAIARAIVEGHGGTIRAYSDGPGRGATFSVELPRDAAAAAPPPPSLSPDSSPTGAKRAMSRTWARVVDAQA